VIWLLVGTASAQSWSSAGYGVDTARWAASSSWVSAVRINLCHPGIEMRATTSAERGQRTSTWANSVGVTAAINGGFFSSGYAPDQGRAAGGGVEWPDSTDTGVRGFLAFGEHSLYHSTAGLVEALPSWTEHAVNGDATLVSNGVAVDCGGCGGGRAPRSAIGYSQDQGTLWLVAVDGRSSASAGVTIDQLAVILADLGAWRAMNVDGGGSTTLWTSSGGVLNDPSDGSERTVGNHLGVFAPGTGLTHNCPTGWAAQFVGLSGPGVSGTTVSAEAGSVVTLTMTVKNTGTETWDPSNTKLAPLPRDSTSAQHAAGWMASNRVVGPTTATAPGETATFVFPLTMPATVGASVRWEFSFLQELVAWFGNSWGPVDGSFYLTLNATEPVQDTGDPPDTQDSDPPDTQRESDPPDSPTLDTQVETGPWPRTPMPPGVCGCAAAGGSGGWIALLLLAALRRRSEPA
jgi:hypothetical protein